MYIRILNGDTLSGVITALCADYPRRSAALQKKNISHRTEMEYRYFNFRIYEAAKEIAGDADADAFILDIGLQIGYAKTSLSHMCESIYKEKKRLIKENIAKKLHFSDS